jgi:hypothetical protein
MDFLGGLLQVGGGLLGGLFGGEEGAQPSQQVSGWQALPREVQEAFLKTYLPDVKQIYQAGPNQYEKQAESMLGGGIAGLRKDLPQYMSPFQEQVIDRTLKRYNDQAGQMRNNIMGQAGLGGLGSFGSSALGTQLAQLDKNNLDRQLDYLSQANQENYSQALGLRQGLLNDLLQAGQMPYQRVSRLGTMLNAFPGGSQSTGAVQGTPNWASKLGGGMMSLGSLFS